MPELPEVETIKNGLTDLINSKISEIIIRFPRLRYPLEQNELDQALQQRITQITRRAKYLILHLEIGYLLFHLGMSGKLTLYKRQAAKISKHDHVDIIADEYTLRYNDPRRFGCLLYLTSLNHPLLTKLGPEPLSAEFNHNYFRTKLKTRTSKIKQLLMDNTIVVGVGNIYACEALFLSKISPLRLAKELTSNESKLLLKNIQQVLKQAIEAGGSTLRDYKNAKGELGYFQQQHQVYSRTNLACKVCQTPIKAVIIAQRNSFYCPHCQN